ncbi:MAG: hypothetical protein NTZ24_01990 [Deltaproteobacteria bacterium]|nr:hypothetical protein [Deltaproteobacteria bacterium]
MRKRDRSFDIFIIDAYEPLSRYRDNRTGEDDGYAHLKRQITGREVIAAVAKASLDSGS